MGRICDIVFLVLLSKHIAAFTHYKDLFSKSTEKLKTPEKNWKSCKHPGQIRNGQTVVWGEGLLLEYICDKTFFAAGLTHGACDPSTGKWTIPIPVCVASGCPDLQAPTNGVVEIDNNGGVATFTCAGGFYLMGSKKLFCESGKWRGRFPMCLESDTVVSTPKPESGLSKSALRHADESCFQYQIDPPTISKAVLKTSYVFSEFRGRYVMIATFSCVGGFKLANPSADTMYCHNSQWGATITPKCVLENDPCRKANGGCSQICVAKVKRYSCTCREGYTLGSDYRSCYDLNECVLDNGGCAQDCHNTLGSFFCACTAGWVAKGKDCVDINECEGDHKCPGPCINRPGSYQCNCTIKGYRPSTALHFCKDVDECAVDNGGCQDICENRRGSYECRCQQEGLKLADDLHSCVDYDECLRYGKKLCRHGRCLNIKGSYRCECENGFEPSPDGKSCVDSDECLVNNGGCGDRCENQFGYFNCYCDQDGYILGDDGLSCEDIDECAIRADDCEDRCVNMAGTYRCECREAGMVVAQDKISCTECSEEEYYSTRDGLCHSCPANSIVSSRLRDRFARSSTDCECRPGYDGDPRYNRQCVDRDECILGELRCVYGCENTPGGAKCLCPHGYSSQADNVTCHDIDECEGGKSGCNHICENTPGSYRCECDGDGYIMLDDQRTCQDIDECEDVHYCSHGCENVEGSVACVCPDGYSLDTDLRTCKDTDECSDYESPCAQICINNVASFTCECRIGYKLSWDKRTCIDINECMEGEGVCQDSCVNTDGSFHCRCDKQGFHMAEDGFTCTDIDECAQNQNKTLCEQRCQNIPGSYKCDCYPGYRKANSKCVPCPRGFYRALKDDTCKRCPSYSSTAQTARTSIADCKCRTGYHGNLAYNIPCTDINECETDNFGCSDKCINSAGSAYCTCTEGFSLASDRKRCVDIDECKRANRCEQQCVNTVGSYTCGCDLRYFMIGTDDRTCLDINECDDDNFGCSHDCVNRIGSALCACPAGYVLGDDGKTCKDRDECASSNGGCDDRCVNTVGSYRCECTKVGMEKYTYNDKKCVDINECIRSAPCTDICKNTFGSFKCRCRSPGLRLADDGRTCVDMDECSSSPDICDHVCVNMRGSYKCECRPGYYSSGRKCVECPLGTYNSKSSNKRSCSTCPAKSKTLQKGSTSILQCVCGKGFEGEPSRGVNCRDINECETDNGGCDHRCFNSPGSFSCTCRAPYTLQDDKKSCGVVSCPNLQPLKHGIIWPPACTSPVSRHKLKRGTLCTFRCSRGFDLFGHRSTTCQPDSTWSKHTPSCEAKYCDGFKAPTNGLIRPSLCSEDFVAFRQKCTFSCDKGYRVTGKNHLRCKANQRWNSKPPTCVPDNRPKRRG